MTVTGRYALPATEGERVRFRTKAKDGEGVFTLCWLGIEETWDVLCDDGSTVHLHPCFGDSMEPA